MIKYKSKFFAFVLFIAVVAFIYLTFGRIVSFESVKNNSILLNAFVQKHYFLSVAVLASAFLSTAFFLPGSLILTIGSGFLFGPAISGLYASCFLTVGSVLAFLASRHLLGNAVQQRFKLELARFNQEMHRYGRNYLFVLHIVPILPSFLINYLSGLTEMPVRRFAFVTFFALLPGSLVYSFAGRQLAGMESVRDVVSFRMLIALGMLAVLALAPVLARGMKQPGSKAAEKSV